MTTPQPQNHEQGALPAKRRLAWLPLAVIGLGMAAVLLGGYHKHLTLEVIVTEKAHLMNEVERLGPMAVLVFMGLYVAVATFSIPGALPMTLVGGLLFGPIIGGGAAVIAATTGAVLLFLAARSALGASLRDKAKGLAARIAGGFQRDATSYMLFMRLVPAFPFVLVNLVPAVLNVRLWPFLWTTVLGILPGTFAFAHVGAGLGQVFDSQHEALVACRAAGHADCRVTLDPTLLLDRNLIMAFAAVGVLALTPLLARRLFGARGVRLP